LTFQKLKTKPIWEYIVLNLRSEFQNFSRYICGDMIWESWSFCRLLNYIPNRCPRENRHNILSEHQIDISQKGIERGRTVVSCRYLLESKVKKWHVAIHFITILIILIHVITILIILIHFITILIILIHVITILFVCFMSYVLLYCNTIF